MPTLKIEFDNQEALNNFAIWLCEYGEQQYWNCMELVEEDSEEITTVLKFEYHEILDRSLPTNDPKRYGEWLKNNTIKTVCGRLTDNKEEIKAAYEKWCKHRAEEETKHEQD